MNNLSKTLIALVIVITVLAYEQCSKKSPSTQPIQPSSPAQSTSTTSTLIPDGPWPPIPDASLPVSNSSTTNYYVLLDTSGSMRNEVAGSVKMEAAKKAMLAFVGEVPAHINLGLMFFGPTSEQVALGQNNRKQFISKVKRATPNGRTPLIQSIHQGYQILSQQAQKQGGYGEYQLIVVTDGASSDGDPAPLAKEIVQESPIQIHVIGFGLAEHALNIAGITQYVNANSPQELIDALTAVTQAETEEFTDATEFIATP